MSGGAGVGDPLERDPSLVAIDVLNEYVSIQSAKNDYGVIIDPNTLQIDIKATVKLREDLKKRN